MINFPNCKINLGLSILEKREDNFHNIETVFFPVPFSDVVEIISADKFSFSCSGIETGRSQDNLCIKAYQLLKKDFPALPEVKMHLHKAIPVGAGLGGGSADAAFTLRLLNEKYALKISNETLMQYALKLGSDCPFFILNQPAFATGRGEQLKKIEIKLSGYFLLLVNPGIHINTGWAFSQVTPSAKINSLSSVISKPIDSWKFELVNDFEVPVFEKYPEIRSIKEKLYADGAVYASMSGTGSTVYGIFKQQPVINFPTQYFQKSIYIKNN
ncbi:4-(cytidine 5'-diphospho)-2-C-methyl-D-erythritol kinase [soil metagenome]